jgi:hypothetical protein
MKKIVLFFPNLLFTGISKPNAEGNAPGRAVSCRERAYSI